MISEVADIILMAEACAEGQCIIGLSFLTTSCNGTPSKMIPMETEERFMSKCCTIEHQQHTQWPLHYLDCIILRGVSAPLM